jgi:hypothetical protein
MALMVVLNRGIGVGYREPKGSLPKDGRRLAGWLPSAPTREVGQVGPGWGTKKPLKNNILPYLSYLPYLL